MLKRLMQVKWRVLGAAAFCFCLWVAVSHAQQGQENVDAETTVSAITQVLGRPTDHLIALNVLAPSDLESYVEYGTKPGIYSAKTAVTKSAARTPFEVVMDKLKPNTRYYYRLQFRESGQGAYSASPEYSFETQRPPNTPFV